MEAAMCAELLDLFGGAVVVTTPAAAGAKPADERGGLGQTQQRKPVATDDEVSNVCLNHHSFGKIPHSQI